MKPDMKLSDQKNENKIFEFRPMLPFLLKNYDPKYGHMGTSTKLLNKAISIVHKKNNLRVIGVHKMELFYKDLLKQP